MSFSAFDTSASGSSFSRISSDLNASEYASKFLAMAKTAAKVILILGLFTAVGAFMGYINNLNSCTSDWPAKRWAGLGAIGGLGCGALLTTLHYGSNYLDNRSKQ